MFPKIILNDLRKFPIKEISKKTQQPFIEKANKMLELNQQLQKKSAKFLNRTQEHFFGNNSYHKGFKPLGKITKKLSVFYNYDFKTFVAELKKQKVVLSLVQQDEWQDYFDSYKTKINQLQNKIQQTDDEIDQMVYALYELSEEEIKIVEGSSK